ncbi:MAG: type II/IV secretion system protein, partial [Verrucomicrobia bacterium]|nr:type II/IV secretion system protein [Verrucomicrobiota bacterium]
VCDFASRHSGARRIHLPPHGPAPEMRRTLPIALARRLRVAPVGWTNERLLLATPDPFNVPALDLVRQTAGCELDVVTAPEREVLAALDRLETAGPTLGESIERSVRDTTGQESPAVAETQAVPVSQPDAPVIALVQQMLERAVRCGASDLHLEPLENAVSLRLRRDGVLHPDVLIPKALQPAVTSRLKLIGDLDVTETRRPQDGRATVVVDHRPVHLRLSSLPTRFGESVVVRLLDAGAEIRGLQDLGLPPGLEHRLRQLVETPHGVLLVTGPTGSGKTTTLYAILSELNEPGVGIFTLEDPIELTLPGIRQTQIQEEIGLTFGTALRSLLRQDPDILLVGETRDAETAGLMIRAALTGHLVFSTLHTNDAPGAIPRLLDLGVEPCLIPDSLVGAVAQRLVRRLCTACRHRVFHAESSSLPLEHPLPAGQPMDSWEAVGCPECRGTGYRGRQGLFELMVPDGQFHDAVMRRAPHSEFDRLARAAGMVPLAEDGWRLVHQGVTTVAEVLQATRSAASRT